MSLVFANVGGPGSDTLGDGGFSFNSSGFGELIGGTGADHYGLGNDVAPLYPGAGFKTILDFAAPRGDKIFVTRYFVTQNF